MSMTYEQLKSQVSTFRNKVATERARLEQAEKQEKEIKDRILKEYEVSPEDLDAELAKTQADIQTTAGKVVELINKA